MNVLRRTLQHLLNPLHVYCRLRGLGLSVARARRVAGWWESLAGDRLYRRTA